MTGGRRGRRRSSPASVRCCPTRAPRRRWSRPATAVRWVMKFSGAGPGPFGLLVEFLALGSPRRSARRCPRRAALAAGGLPLGGRHRRVRRDAPAELRLEPRVACARGRAAGRARARSPAARPARSTRSRGPMRWCRTSTGRRATRTSSSRTGRLRAIDYDACLYLSRALGRAAPADGALPAGHLLDGRAVPARRCRPSTSRGCWRRRRTTGWPPPVPTAPGSPRRSAATWRTGRTAPR